MKRWQCRQAENEKEFCDRYVYIYHEENGHIQRQPKGLLAPATEKVLLICVREGGRLYLDEYISKILRKEGLNANSLRHTHATQLIENGALAKAVAERFVHVNTQITQNLYIHNTEKLQEAATAIFGKTLQTNV